MIITLPITVKNDAPLGYWLTPTVTDALSRQLGENGSIYYGMLGHRKPSSEEEAAYLDKLNYLNVRCERRTDAEIVSDLLTICNELALRGTIESRQQDCIRCPCGRLELPTHIATYAKEKTFIRAGDAYICRVCGEAGTIERVSSRILRPNEHDVLARTGIYPNWYRSEVVELQRQLQEQGIPWSKDRTTEFCGDLDPDLVWSLIPLLLSRSSPQERVRIAITNHVIRQALVTVLLARVLDPSFEADLIIMPCIDHPGSLDKWKLDRLVNLGYSGTLLKYMLIGSLGWQTKNARLHDMPAGVEYRRFHLLERYVESVESDKSVHRDLADVLRNLSQQNLVQGLKHVFNPDKFDYRSLVGVL